MPEKPFLRQAGLSHKGKAEGEGRWTDRQTDGWMYGNCTLCSIVRLGFRAAAEVFL